MFWSLRTVGVILVYVVRQTKKKVWIFLILFPSVYDFCSLGQNIFSSLVEPRVWLWCSQKLDRESFIEALKQFYSAKPTHLLILFDLPHPHLTTSMSLGTLTGNWTSSEEMVFSLWISQVKFCTHFSYLPYVPLLM